MSTLDLINAIQAKDSTAIESSFNAVMADKITAKLDTMRQEVAQNMFKEQPAAAPVVEEETIIEQELQEVLGKDASAGEWISDFVHSDNPKFKGKSKAERTKMALGAYYAAHPEKSNK